MTHVIVIGGGIVGASTGLWLRRAGIDVTVIDRDGWAAGASYGNAGILASCSMVPVTTPGIIRHAPGMAFDPNSPLFVRWSYLPRMLGWLRKYLSHSGDADTRRISAGIAQVVTDSVDQHLSLVKGTGAEQFLTVSDYSYAYDTQADFDADSYAIGIRAEHGHAPQLITGDAVRKLEPNLNTDITCLASYPNHGYISDPGSYVAAIGAAFEAEGGRLLKALATDFEMQDGHITRVLTDQGPVACDKAVVATGVWSKPLMSRLGLKIPLESERGYHILFKNARGGPNHPIMLASGKFVATPMAEGVRCAGIVEFGGLEAGPSRPPFDLLRKQTKAAFPNMTWDDEIEWQGHRPATTDSLPLIGQVRETGVYTGFGHHHIGLTAGPKTGRLLSQLITGQTPNVDLAPYEPTRFS